MFPLAEAPVALSECEDGIDPEAEYVSSATIGLPLCRVKLNFGLALGGTR